MNEHFTNYAWLGGAAFLGVLARAARWTTPDGKFSFQKMIFECLTAPAIGVMVAGAGNYLNPNLDPMILGAAAALFGLLGPAAIEALALKYFDKKLGI